MAYVRRTGAPQTLINWDAGATAATMRILKQADENLYKELRAELRKKANKLKAAQKAAVMDIESSGTSGRGSGANARQQYATGGVATSKAAARRGERARGLRSSAAAALKIEYREKATASRPFLGIRVRMSSKAMPYDQRRLPKHMNYGRWRHPVFGNKDAWTSQSARPEGWFDKTFADMKNEIRAALGAAVDRAYAKAGLLR